MPTVGQDHTPDLEENKSTSFLQFLFAYTSSGMNIYLEGLGSHKIGVFCLNETNVGFIDCKLLVYGSVMPNTQIPWTCTYFWSILEERMMCLLVIQTTCFAVVFKSYKCKCIKVYSLISLWQARSQPTFTIWQACFKHESFSAPRGGYTKHATNYGAS